uniref:Sodium/hydrogen exchanger n=1 Tax=Palpitomonas bilix TaxID=652834 RepID=A0A7S3D0U5_9EUKA|mmetsp:Transcript_16946/g.42555  ORF Transcript_16946/g.42555 Transcript_16946/m.42555 type:complete len:563 (+) Transcript_16946:216-1904(+)|eukprot:CAMPEP_0113872160 /NCGR_PEP_ID=MMETSP0780_2-20120614/3046_1 /TAXON_ID=652834 /ORGANISM="Palpitomonas bilix" /LENGTH=562 /DNA_ID=CAMNT_0000857635 /DNA_START=136 /DNA_END=1824 /DNA_ORIENTATION=+ /assembly_acc=CAM_ASM_000599
MSVAWLWPCLLCVAFLPFSVGENTTTTNTTGNATDISVEAGAIDLFIVLLILLVLLVLSFVIERKKLVYVTESGVAMILGVLIGLILHYALPASEEIDFGEGVFFFGLLPPIIFEAGFSMNKMSFFRNMGAILLFAVVGTIISTICIGLLLYASYPVHGVGLSVLECLIFGSLISAVDPVATLSVFKKLNAKPLLFSLVFGESVLNDAVSIVLFDTFARFASSPTSDIGPSNALAAVGQFFLLFVGSILVGVAFGLISAAVLKHVRMEEYAMHQVGLCILFPYLSYFLAVTLSLSGIMSMFFCGIIMAHYTIYNVPEETASIVKGLFSTLAMLAESFVFTYVGLSVFAYKPKMEWSYALILLSILFCLLARAINIFPLSLLANACRKNKKIGFKMQVVMWWSGLRGAIAYALAINFPLTEHKAYIQATTLVIVLSTTLIFGGTTAPILKGLKLVEKEEEMKEETIETPLHKEEKKEKKEKRSLLHRKWKVFDHHFLKPVFGGEVKQKKEDEADEGLVVNERQEGGREMEWSEDVRGSDAGESRVEEGRPAASPSSYTPPSLP